MELAALAGTTMNSLFGFVRHWTCLRRCFLASPLYFELIKLFLDKSKALTISGKSDLALHSKLIPRFIMHEILHLLTHDVAPEAVNFFINEVWQYHCYFFPGENPSKGSSCAARPYPDARFFLGSAVDEKTHRYLHILHKEGFYTDGLILLCALQSLANVTNLTSSEQQIIWRAYRSSWHAITKFFAC
jgi:hypothetical protein